MAHCIHQCLEDVAIVQRGLAQSRERLFNVAVVLRLEGNEPLNLRRFLMFGSPSQFDLVWSCLLGDPGEGVDADDGELSTVLCVFVKHGVVLNPPTLVARFHGAEHPAALGDSLELLEHRRFDEISEFLHDETALE